MSGRCCLQGCNDKPAATLEVLETRFDGEHVSRVRVCAAHVGLLRDTPFDNMKVLGVAWDTAPPAGAVE